MFTIKGLTPAESKAFIGNMEQQFQTTENNATQALKEQDAQDQADRDRS